MSDPDSDKSPQQQGLPAEVGPSPDPPLPDNLASRPASLAHAEARAASAQDAFRFDLLNPELEIDYTKDLVYRIEYVREVDDVNFAEYRDNKKKGMSEEEALEAATTYTGKLVKELTLDKEATSRLRQLNIAQSDLKLLKASTGAVRSYLDVESDKTSEVTRQRNDFITRAKSAADLEAAGQEYQAKKQAFNQDRAVGIQKGLFSSNAPYMVQDNSVVSGLSDIIRQTIPDKLRPDYTLDHAVGLPAYGEGTFRRPRMPDESGLHKFLYGGSA